MYILRNITNGERNTSGISMAILKQYLLLFLLGSMINRWPLY
nr:MAG TPA: hypothetical protein [Caudoviricetes sp.]